jgi:hypothetical protein
MWKQGMILEHAAGRATVNGHEQFSSVVLPPLVQDLHLALATIQTR